MNQKTDGLASRLGVLAFILGMAAMLSSCGKPSESRQAQVFKSDGSSTVYPITNAIAAEYQVTQTQANPNQLKLLAIDNGKGSVLPSRQTVEKAQYQLLDRPLFIYVKFKSAHNKSEVRDFVEFYLQKEISHEGKLYHQTPFFSGSLPNVMDFFSNGYWS